jgi:fatty-acid desaturase
LVNFEFGHGLMIADIVIPFELWKKIRNFKFPFIISPMVVHIQLKFKYRYILRISIFSLNLVVVQRLWTKTNLSFLNVGKILNFQFQHSYFCGNVCSHYFGYKYAKRLRLNNFSAFNIV